MIPLSVMGYEILIRKMWNTIHTVKESTVKKKLVVNYTAIFAVLVMVTYIGIYKFDGSDCLTFDTGYYEQYLEDMVMPYTAETVRDINIINAERRHYKELSEYFAQLLGENGIDY